MKTSLAMATLALLAAAFTSASASVPAFLSSALHKALAPCRRRLLMPPSPLRTPPTRPIHSLFFARAAASSGGDPDKPPTAKGSNSTAGGGRGRRPASGEAPKIKKEADDGPTEEDPLLFLRKLSEPWASPLLRALDRKRMNRTEVTKAAVALAKYLAGVTKAAQGTSRPVSVLEAELQTEKTAREGLVDLVEDMYQQLKEEKAYSKELEDLATKMTEELKNALKIIRTMRLKERGALTVRGALEMMMQEDVRPALGLAPLEPVTAEHWNRYLELHPDMRARIERQVSARGDAVGQQIVDIHAKLVAGGEAGLE